MRENFFMNNIKGEVTFKKNLSKIYFIKGYMTILDLGVDCCRSKRDEHFKHD